jgi:hypothetical protein
MLDDNIVLRDEYLKNHGLEWQDFGLNYAYPIIPSTNWDWYKDHKFGVKSIYRRAGMFLIYLDVKGEPYLVDEVPYGVVRFLGQAVAVPADEEAPKVLSQWGRRSEIHFEPMRDGTSWEALPHGSKVIHCESLVKAKAVHKATGLPCIGYNGVNGYSSAKQGVELIHEYAGFAFDKMDNVILFDSDVHTNPRVIAAREGLSHKLRHILNCSLVSWASLPQRVQEGKPPSNWGPDDFLLEHGADALQKVISSAVPYQDEEFSSLVEAMNERIRWVRGQSMVFDRTRRALVKWQDAVLTHRNVNRNVVQGKSKKVVYGTDVWLQSIHRQEVDNVGYRYLDSEFFDRAGESLANEYVPDGADPGPHGLAEDSIVHQMLVRLFKPDDLRLIRSYLKFLKFTAEKPTSYCILWSNARGIGKGWFTELARALLGKRHVAPATADSLAEKFNLHTINTRLLIAHEFHASSAAYKKLALNYLKTYVGDETIMVRAMNRNPYQAEVRAGLIITVNDKSEMPSDGLGDRRQWYIEAGAGMRELGLELWPPEDQRWRAVFDALRNPDHMGAVARWVMEGDSIDFTSWRPPLTEERAADLMEGMSGPVQAAHEVLKDCRDLGVRVLEPKAIRQLMIEKLEGQELYIVGSAFGRCLKDGGWWNDKKYERCSSAKSHVWFVQPRHDLPSTVEVAQWLKEDALKIVRKY